METTERHTAARIQRPEAGIETLYTESLRHLQEGQWNEAIAGLEKVLKLAPDHGEARASLEEARIKASLDHRRPRPKRDWPKKWLKRTTFVVVTVTIMLALAIGAVWVRARWVEPVRSTRQEAEQWAQQVAQAQTYAAERNYTSAELAFRALLAQDPTNQDAKRGLAQVQEEMALAESYDKAQQAIAQGDWSTATQLLADVSAQRPAYRDVPQLQSYVQKQQQLIAQFDGAETAYRDGDWLAAVSAYTALIKLDPEFQQQVVADHLFESYLKQGVHLVENTGGELGAVRDAIALYQKALALKPQHPQVVQELALAEKYLEAHAKLEKGDMVAAITALRWVEGQRLSYADGKAAALLKAASESADAGTPFSASDVGELIRADSGSQDQCTLLMRQAEEARAESDYAQAEQYYRQALAIAVPWSLTPYVRIAALHVELENYDLAVGALRTAFAVLSGSEVAISSSLYAQYIDEGDLYAQEEDYVNALAQYDMALLIVQQECSCGLEDWRILP